MKRAASIALLLVLVSLTFSPLSASSAQSHPAACPRIANHNHCHSAGEAADERAVTAQSAECPMRCCPTVRSSAVEIPYQRAAIVSFHMAALEPRAQELAASLSVTQVCFERGPPQA
jgi:hypothetical protein